MARQMERGFTIVELMVVVVLIAIIAAIALPSFKSLLENRKLIAAADHLQADFQFAKTEAVKRSRTMFISFVNVGAANWCYGINQSSTCDCSVANDCDTKVVNSTDLPAVILNVAAAANVSYDQFRGFASNAGNFKFGLGGRSTGVALALSGRSTTCTDNSIGGLPSCP